MCVQVFLPLVFKYLLTCNFLCNLRTVSLRVSGYVSIRKANSGILGTTFHYHEQRGGPTAGNLRREGVCRRQDCLVARWLLQRPTIIRALLTARTLGPSLWRHFLLICITSNYYYPSRLLFLQEVACLCLLDHPISSPSTASVELPRADCKSKRAGVTYTRTCNKSYKNSH